MAEEAGMLHVNRLSKQLCQSAHSLVFRDADTLCTGSHDFIKVMEALRRVFFHSPLPPSLLPSLLLSTSTCTSVLICIPPVRYVFFWSLTFNQQHNLCDANTGNDFY